MDDRHRAGRVAETRDSNPLNEDYFFRTEFITISFVEIGSVFSHSELEREIARLSIRYDRACFTCLPSRYRRLVR